jgi:hypothetical protein
MDEKARARLFLRAGSAAATQKNSTCASPEKGNLHYYSFRTVSVSVDAGVYDVSWKDPVLAEREGFEPSKGF